MPAPPTTNCSTAGEISCWGVLTLLFQCEISVDKQAHALADPRHSEGCMKTGAKLIMLIDVSDDGCLLTSADRCPGKADVHVSFKPCAMTRAHWVLMTSYQALVVQHAGTVRVPAWGSTTFHLQMYTWQQILSSTQYGQHRTNHGTRSSTQHVHRCCRQSVAHSQPRSPTDMLQLHLRHTHSRVVEHHTAWLLPR